MLVNVFTSRYSVKICLREMKESEYKVWFLSFTFVINKLLVFIWNSLILLTTLKNIDQTAKWGRESFQQIVKFYKKHKIVGESTVDSVALVINFA